MKNDIKKIVILISIIVVIVVSALYFLKTKKLEEGIVDEHNGYVLESGKSSYYNSLFAELKDSTEKTDDDRATIIAKLFLTDVFSLKYAVSKNDVGGVQFVYEEFRSDFTHIARDTLYKFVENNIYGTRKQELPVVKEITIDSISDDVFTYNEDELNVKKISATITYEKDLSYQKEVELLLYKKNDKFEVIKMD